MRIGLSVPQIGPLADPETIVSVARAAESAGYDSLWAMDRLLAPLEPRSSYPGTADGALPAEHHLVLDPLVVLGMAATVTERVRLGTNVLVAPWYPPILLARSLTTLDRLSGGRLVLGFGLGWSEDEYEAAGVPKRDRGRRLDEMIDVLEVIWADEVVEHDGRYSRIAPSTIEPKPIQRPRPPLHLAAFSPPGLDRIARRADGWLPAGLPHEVLAMLWADLRDRTAAYGRDPDGIELIVRANVHLTDAPIEGADRPVFCGSVEQVAGDVETTERIGAHEVLFDLHYSTRSGSEVLETAAALTAVTAPAVAVG